MLKSNSRDPAWRWYVSRDNWPSDAPIKFVWGTAMVTSIDLVVLLAAGGVHLTMLPDNLLWVGVTAVGVWVADVARQQNVTLNYHHVRGIRVGSCASFDMVTANIAHPVDTAFRCMHSKGDRCCDIAMQPFLGWQPKP